MKKPLLTVGVKEMYKCPICINEFDPEDGTYEIGHKEVLYCSEHCLNEELLMQEEKALQERNYERSRYDA